MSLPSPTPLAFSKEALDKIEHLKTRYPDTQAACLPVLHVAQDEFGYLPDAAIELVATTLNLPVAHVFGVVTFYTMYHREPTGRHKLWVCTNVSCMLKGGYEVLHTLEKKLGVHAGQTTADGEFTLIEEECLAACAGAPCLVAHDRYYLDVKVDDLDKILDEVKASPADTASQRRKA